MTIKKSLKKIVEIDNIIKRGVSLPVISLNAYKTLRQKRADYVWAIQSVGKGKAS